MAGVVVAGLEALSRLEKERREQGLLKRRAAVVRGCLPEKERTAESRGE